MLSIFITTLPTLPVNPFNVGSKFKTPVIGISVNSMPFPLNPAPVDMIVPLDFILPETSRGAVGFPTPTPILPLLIIVIRSSP